MTGLELGCVTLIVFGVGFVSGAEWCARKTSRRIRSLVTMDSAELIRVLRRSRDAKG